MRSASRRRTRAIAYRALASTIVALISLSGPVEAQTRPPFRVKVVRAETSDYTENYRLTGFIAARIQSNISFRTSGRVANRRIEIGDHVTADQVLAELDPKDQQTAVDNARAALDSAQAQLRQAQAAFDRQDALLDKGFTTRVLFDQTEAQLRSAKAAVTSAEASLGSALEQLSYTVLKAGIDGIIVARNVEIGQVVLPGQAVFTIAQDGPRDAVFDVQEYLIAHPPKAAARAAIALLSDPGIKATGSPREISPTVDSSAGTVRVKVALDKTPSQMTLGASVVGLVPVEFHRAFMLPEGALYEWEGKPAVWIVDRNSKRASLRTVAVDAYLKNTVVLSGGIESGDLVAVAGVQSLRLDEEVEIVGALP